jgi:hypothetical protein
MDTLRSTAASSLPGTLMGLHNVSATFRRRLVISLGVVDAELETGRAPLYEVERRLCFESTSSSSAVAGHDVTTVQQRDRHVLSIARVADDHLVVRLKAWINQQYVQNFGGRVRTYTGR